MQSDEPIVECLYDWGRLLRLYNDHIELNGKAYALRNLVRTQAYYQRLFGISSARLELHFPQQKVLLRGIAAIDAVQRILEHVNRSRRLEVPQTEMTLEGRLRLRAAQQLQTEELQPFAGAPTQLILPLSGEAPPGNGHARTVTASIKVPRWLFMRQEQRERRMKQRHAERLTREYGFDVERLAQRLREPHLPRVYVPTRLLTGEYAHYCTDATLCEEPLNTSSRYNYLPKDQGTLIFTNKRIIYLGRKRQFVLTYARLLHVSYLQGAVAFQADHWSKREVFEVRLALECSMYLEAILQRYRQEQKNKTAQKEQEATPIPATNPQDTAALERQTPPATLTDDSIASIPTLKMTTIAYDSDGRKQP